MEKFKEKFGKIRRDQWILFLLVGILLTVLVLPSSPQEKTKDDPAAETAELLAADTISDMENRLEEILSHMEGAGRVKVMVTQKATGKKIVEKDTPVSERQIREEGGSESRSTSEKDQEEATVYEKDSSGSQQPYVIQETAPSVEGVLVLAEGGDNGVVVKNITDAVMALFGLEVHKIKVMKMD